MKRGEEERETRGVFVSGGASQGSREGGREGGREEGKVVPDGGGHNALLSRVELGPFGGRLLDGHHRIIQWAGLKEEGREGGREGRRGRG